MEWARPVAAHLQDRCAGVVVFPRLSVQSSRAVSASERIVHAREAFGDCPEPVLERAVVREFA